MVFSPPSDWELRTFFAIIASLVVAALTVFMAYRVLRSYRSTLDRRLLFVFGAFLIFVIKSIFVSVAVIPPHELVQHDWIEAIGALMDVAIVVLLFIPFITPQD